MYQFPILSHYYQKRKISGLSFREWIHISMLQMVLCTSGMVNSLMDIIITFFSFILLLEVVLVQFSLSAFVTEKSFSSKNIFICYII